jgi:hypothetical protein
MEPENIVIDDRFGTEYQGNYLFKEIAWAKRNRIIQQHTKYSKISGEVESSDFIAIQAETIMASLHGQPDSKPITLEKLLDEENGVPIALGELLSKVTNRLNGLAHEDIRFLLEQLGEGSRIQLFQSFGFVKSSVNSQVKSSENQQEKSKDSSLS